MDIYWLPPTGYLPLATPVVFPAAMEDPLISGVDPKGMGNQRQYGEEYVRILGNAVPKLWESKVEMQVFFFATSCHDL